MSGWGCNDPDYHPPGEIQYPEGTMSGYSITLIPLSFAIGKVTIRNKTVWAFGPFRFSIHRNLAPWAETQQWPK